MGSSEAEPLVAKNIKYLAFEGGGGKGNAYLGAIKAIEDLGILTQLAGVSGSSAGAITALLISCGYTFNEIVTELSNPQNDFFDEPNENDLFSISGLRRKVNEFEIDTDNALTILLDPYIMSMILSIVYSLKKEGMFNKAINFRNTVLPAILNQKIGLKRFIAEELKDNTALASKFITGRNFDKYLRSLTNTLGLFAGKNLHEFFKKLIAAKYNSLQHREKDTDGLITFQQHYDAFRGIELKVTSVNLQKEQLHIFSQKTTPHFPVATAVRMSMGLPTIFKPVVITGTDLRNYERANNVKFEKKESTILQGVWVDGGLLDNAPIRFFGEDATEKALLFRLGKREQQNSIQNLSNLLEVWLINLGAFGGGSGQITRSTYDESKVIQLAIQYKDTTKKKLVKLGLLDFNIPTDILDKFIEINDGITKNKFQESGSSLGSP